MSEKAIEFLQEWITEKVQAPSVSARLETEAKVLARECAARAAEAGVPMEDIVEEVGDLEELITTKLEDAAEAEEEGHGRDGAEPAVESRGASRLKGPASDG